METRFEHPEQIQSKTAEHLLGLVDAQLQADPDTDPVVQAKRLERLQTVREVLASLPHSAEAQARPGAVLDKQKLLLERLAAAAPELLQSQLGERAQALTLTREFVTTAQKKLENTTESTAPDEAVEQYRGILDQARIYVSGLAHDSDVTDTTEQIAIYKRFDDLRRGAWQFTEQPATFARQDIQETTPLAALALEQGGSEGERMCAQLFPELDIRAEDAAIRMTQLYEAQFALPVNILRPEKSDQDIYAQKTEIHHLVRTTLDAMSDQSPQTVLRAIEPCLQRLPALINEYIMRLDRIASEGGLDASQYAEQIGAIHLVVRECYRVRKIVEQLQYRQTEAFDQERAQTHQQLVDDYLSTLDVNQQANITRLRTLPIEDFLQAVHIGTTSRDEESARQHLLYARQAEIRTLPLTPEDNQIWNTLQRQLNGNITDAALMDIQRAVGQECSNLKDQLTASGGQSAHPDLQRAWISKSALFARIDHSREYNQHDTPETIRDSELFLVARELQSELKIVLADVAGQISFGNKWKEYVAIAEGEYYQMSDCNRLIQTAEVIRSLVDKPRLTTLIERYRHFEATLTTVHTERLDADTEIILTRSGTIERGALLDIKFKTKTGTEVDLKQYGPTDTQFVSQGASRMKQGFAADTQTKTVFIPMASPLVRERLASYLLTVGHEMGHLFQDREKLPPDSSMLDQDKQTAFLERDAWARALVLAHKLKADHGVNLLSIFKDDPAQVKRYIDLSLGTYQHGADNRAFKETGSRKPAKNLFVRGEVPPGSADIYYGHFTTQLTKECLTV